jgi:hypothetical protein
MESSWCVGLLEARVHAGSGMNFLIASDVMSAAPTSFFKRIAAPRKSDPDIWSWPHFRSLHRCTCQTLSPYPFKKAVNLREWDTKSNLDTVGSEGANDPETDLLVTW